MTQPLPILCESCGYDATSLETLLPTNPNTPCPECGLRVQDSLPERRIGSPWQVRRSISSLYDTALRFATMPRCAWSEVSIDSRANRSLLNRSLLLISIAWPGAYCLPGGINALLIHTDIRLLFDACVLWLLGAAVALLILHTLCYIESLGLRLFARCRNWRTDRHIALAIIAHASAGWWLGPILTLAFLLVVVSSAAMAGGSTDHLLVPVAVLFFLQFLLPLLVFEILVYLGFRALRFANFSRAAPAPQPPPAPPLPSPP